jgi:hypothetical protein
VGKVFYTWGSLRIAAVIDMVFSTSDRRQGAAENRNFTQSRDFMDIGNIMDRDVFVVSYCVLYGGSFSTAASAIEYVCTLFITQ